MLKDEALRVEIIQLHHDVLVAKHRRKQKITELVTRNYQWLEVMRDIRLYRERCNMCQRMKNKIEILVKKLKLSKILKKL